MADENDRQARLAAQLRQNLRRRKTQVRSVAEREADTPDVENSAAPEPKGPSADPS